MIKVATYVFENAATNRSCLKSSTCVAMPSAHGIAGGVWTDLARERLAARSPGNYAYNVFGVSARDLERIRELQARHFREVRDLIARSQPVERVVLSIQHLIPLDHPTPNEPLPGGG